VQRSAGRGVGDRRLDAPYSIYRPDLRALPSYHYEGSEDWVLPYARADVTMLGATLDTIPDQAHLGASFAAAETVLGAIGSRLR
jgi:hypothetical protein